MSNKLLGSIKQLLFEEDAGSATTQRVAPVPATAQPVVCTQPAVALAGVAPDSDEVYQKVLAKTDFETTQTGAIFHKYLEALASLPLDATTKFKTAAAEARSLDGLSEEKMLATFDGLKVALHREQDAFSQSVESITAREITARERQIPQISDSIAAKQAEITQLQQQLARVSTELAQARDKVSRAQSQFVHAVQRRSAELDQQKAQFAAWLKG